MKLNLGSGAHPLEGFENLTAPDWRFEDGLGAYPNASVEGITISHALYLVPLQEWPMVFAEFERVLEPGGVVRITEDATDDPRSERYPDGFEGAVTLTSRGLVRTYLELAGLEAADCAPGWSYFKNGSDGSLIQTFHGTPPKVFHIEGVKR